MSSGGEIARSRLLGSEIRPLPRYFFNVHHGAESLDDVGVNLDGPGAAREAAVRAAGEALRDLEREFWQAPEWRMWVTDEGGATVCALRFSADGATTS